MTARIHIRANESLSDHLSHSTDVQTWTSRLGIATLGGLPPSEDVIAHRRIDIGAELVEWNMKRGCDVMRHSMCLPRGLG